MHEQPSLTKVLGAQAVDRTISAIRKSPSEHFFLNLNKIVALLPGSAKENLKFEPTS